MSVFLVTGGAGYIGSHVCKALNRAGHVPVTFDNLSSGDAGFVKWGPLFFGDLLRQSDIADAIRTHRPEFVIHLAAISDPQASEANPVLAHQVNIGGTQALLQEMAQAGVRNLVFGSTASVYGCAKTPPFVESLEVSPTGVYAETKLAAERVIGQACAAWGLNAVIFRFFNVAGSDPERETGEFRSDDGHLIPKVIDCLLRDEEFQIFGRDHHTPDGTCIRDYIHVLDISRAFLACTNRMHRFEPPCLLNLGAGVGTSVIDVVQEAERLIGGHLRIAMQDRRTFDPPILVSDIERANSLLDWRPRHSVLKTIIRDSWQFRQELGAARSGTC